MSSNNDTTPILERLWFADEGDDSGAYQAERSLAATVASVEGLRPFSPAVEELVSTIQSERFNVATVTAIVESDPTLATRVLQTVNSASYALRQPCHSIQTAVSLLGADAVSTLALAMSMFDMFTSNNQAAAIIAQHSVQVGSLAKTLGAHAKVKEADLLFVCGLLHDIGKLLMLQVSDDLAAGAPDEPYPHLLAECANKSDRIHLRERALFGYDHAVLAGYVMRSWGLPTPLPEVTAWHHQPERAKRAMPPIPNLVAAVRLADQLSYELAANTDANDERIETIAADASAQALGLSAKNLLGAWPELIRCMQPSSGEDA